MANPYHAPLSLMRLALQQAAQSAGVSVLKGYQEILSDLAEPILENAARFASDVLSPLNKVGDRTPSRCEPQGVVTPPGFVEAYRRFREDGWASLAAPAEYGGQGLPTLLSAAVTEMWGGANLSFAMCPELTVGALEAMRVHASAKLIGEYAPHLASGYWASAMCLTEPQAGSDLSTLRTRAEPDGEAWRLRGRKIYISWGDHDLTGNIVHFVLARTPDAPPGLKGISLFLVPKNLRAANGRLEKNDIDAVSLEHKMGIRASPTCVMVLGEHGGARGWLIGRLNDGLGCMFTMINHMRLGVGLHSVGLAERSLQLARHYARERLQGRDTAGAQRPIIEHTDVRRMLLLMKSLTQAARGLAYTAAATLDVAHLANDDDARRTAAARRVDLLTPVVKAWCSDVGVEVASLGVQVHGGMGYIDDAEISQVYRDARIGPIFEGTNYIQAQDLLGRKVIRDQGAALNELLAEIEAAAHELPADTAHPLAQLRTVLAQSCTRLRAATHTLIERSAREPDLIGATAHHFLHWLGILAGGWQLALSARRAVAQIDATAARAVVDIAAFYATHVLPRTYTHEAAVRDGVRAVAEASIADL
ncbi:MAG: acyl-CoA dehydrogenase [Gammaproteobacteria bacterium]|nr:acyl-CoA dehydrogenase [Gammaproteobacteria bacterium]